MTKRKRHNHSSAFKAKVAVAALKGERTLTELATQFDAHPNQIRDWKKRLVAGAEDVFGGHTVETEHNEQEVEKLHAKIGQLAMENDFLAKALIGRARATDERAPREDSNGASAAQDSALPAARGAAFDGVLRADTDNRARFGVDVL